MKEIVVRTQQSRELLDITPQLDKAMREIEISSGALHLFVPHTTAAITINEITDPAVREDVVDSFNRLVPQSLSYKHIEGNSHAHIQASMIGSSVIVPVKDGKIALGTWQGVLFCEFDGPRERKLWVTPLAGS